MYVNFLQQVLIKLIPMHELGEDVPNPKWYNENVYYHLHQVRGHRTN